MLATVGLLDGLGEEQRGMLLDTYCMPHDVAALCHAGTMRKRLFHYRRLCEDVLPPDLRLVPDEKCVKTLALNPP